MDGYRTQTRDRHPGPTRRALLGGLAASLLATALPSQVWAARRDRSRVKDVERGRLGTTLYLELEQAPFPCRGKRWRDNTVVVYVPHHHRVSANRGRKVHVVMHFHGHNTTAVEAMRNHELREQLAESRQNAILVIPQLPVRAPTGHPGKLNAEGGLLRLLTDLRQTLQSPKADAALGRAGLHRRTRIGHLCISSHSGGYRAALACIKHGGFPVRELYLFDSLYSGGQQVAQWIGEGQRHKKQWTHKLISYYAGGAVRRQNRTIMAWLKKNKIKYHHEEKEGTLTRAQLTTGRAIFIRTGNTHRGVTHQHNELRDCLYASTLPRRGAMKTNWFNRKHKQRRVEKRDH
jgi:hypothetical protein